MPIQRLDKLLKSNASGRLDKLVEKAQKLQVLGDRLKAGLDDEAAASLLSANVQDRDLIVVAASSAWAARLRFESEALLAAARDAGEDVTRCQVRVSRRGS